MKNIFLIIFPFLCSVLYAQNTLSFKRGEYQIFPREMFSLKNEPELSLCSHSPWQYTPGFISCYSNASSGLNITIFEEKFDGQKINKYGFVKRLFKRLSSFNPNEITSNNKAKGLEYTVQENGIQIKVIYLIHSPRLFIISVPENRYKAFVENINFLKKEAINYFYSTPEVVPQQKNTIIAYNRQSDKVTKSTSYPVKEKTHLSYYNHSKTSDKEIEEIKRNNPYNNTNTTPATATPNPTLSVPTFGQMAMDNNFNKQSLKLAKSYSSEANPITGSEDFFEGYGDSKYDKGISYQQLKNGGLEQWRKDRILPVFVIIAIVIVFCIIYAASTKTHRESKKNSNNHQNHIEMINLQNKTLWDNLFLTFYMNASNDNTFLLPSRPTKKVAVEIALIISQTMIHSIVTNENISQNQKELMARYISQALEKPLDSLDIFLTKEHVIKRCTAYLHDVVYSVNSAEYIPWQSTYFLYKNPCGTDLSQQQIIESHSDVFPLTLRMKSCLIEVYESVDRTIKEVIKKYA